jgi:L-threonylcarbamoyladenylate synthase
MAALIEDLGYPITSTSANRPGAPSANAAASVERDFGGGARLLVLDGGSLPASAPSTVVDCTAPDARLLREGVLTRAELERRVGRWSP